MTDLQPLASFTVPTTVPFFLVPCNGPRGLERDALLIGEHTVSKAQEKPSRYQHTHHHSWRRFSIATTNNSKNKKDNRKPCSALPIVTDFHNRYMHTLLILRIVLVPTGYVHHRRADAPTPTSPNQNCISQPSALPNLPINPISPFFHLFSSAVLRAGHFRPLNADHPLLVHSNLFGHTRAQVAVPSLAALPGRRRKANSAHFRIAYTRIASTVALAIFAATIPAPSWSCLRQMAGS